MKLAKFFSKKKNMVISGLILLGCVILLGILVNYNNEKGTISDSMMGGSAFSGASPVEYSSELSPDNEVSGVNPVVTVDKPSFLEVKDIKTNVNTDNNCNSNTAMDPSELLPNTDGQPMMGAELVNATNKALKDSSVTLMDAGFHSGINTVGSSLRNANLQLRSEFAIPKTNVGPWSQSTIESDEYRRPLDIAV
jgi:hypothetical protein|tara:strand:+ start:89 stop:670 length:582 start_codon:yes stop_codon:yes gene_type:complete